MYANRFVFIAIDIEHRMVIADVLKSRRKVYKMYEDEEENEEK